MEYLFVLLFNAGLAFIPASVADKKGYSFAGFWCLSFFLSFLIVLIVALCLSDKYETPPQYYPAPAYAAPPPAYGKRCRHCGAYINEGDVFCRQCGTDQAKADVRPASGTRCKRCGSYIDEGEIFCRKCGAKQTGDNAGSPAAAPAEPEPEVKSYRVNNLPVSSLGFISCPGCGERQRVDRDECLKCGAKFLHY